MAALQRITPFLRLDGRTDDARACTAGAKRARATMPGRKKTGVAAMRRAYAATR